MKPTLRLRTSAAVGFVGLTGTTPGLAGFDAPNLGGNAPDLAGVAELRQQAALALEQTREARRTGEIENAAAEALNEIETGLTGIPEAGTPGLLTARIVAAGDAKAQLPAVPLAGLTVRLKVNDKVVQEEETTAFGLVDLELPKEEKGAYEIEVLGPRCDVLACQKGRWNPKQPTPAHRIELARSAELKPHLERSAPIEEGIRQARTRAQLAHRVAVKALDAQEKRLVEYLGEIDELLKCGPTERAAVAEQPPLPSAPEPPPQTAPVEAAPTAQREAETDAASLPTAKPTSKPARSKRGRFDNNKKSQ